MWTLPFGDTKSLKRSPVKALQKNHSSRHREKRVMLSFLPFCSNYLLSAYDVPGQGTSWSAKLSMVVNVGSTETM